MEHLLQHLDQRIGDGHPWEALLAAVCAWEANQQLAGAFNPGEQKSAFGTIITRKGKSTFSEYVETKDWGNI